METELCIGLSKGSSFKEFPEESLSQNNRKFHLLMEVYFSIDIKER